MSDVRTFEDFMKLDVFRLRPDELYQLRSGTYQDLIAAGFTGFFLASKNSEVQPISLNDMTRVLLQDQNISNEQILTKEHAIRRSINYENEVATMFEFVMFYAKSWKIACEDKLKTQSGEHLEQIYTFLSDIEGAAYDFSKSVLVDADSLRFKPCVLVASLFSMTIELHLLLNHSKEDIKQQPRAPLYLEHVRIACDIWDDLTKKIFGKFSLKPI